MSSLTHAIIATLRYSDHFAHPLTEAEIYPRLIKHSCTKRELNTSLNTLSLQGKIQQTGRFYHLPSRQEVIRLRQQREDHSRLLYSRALNLTRFLSKLPSILAVHLTGSLAVFNSDPGDDIDLLLITKSGRLWTTRLLLTFTTTALGLRRTPKSASYAGKLCLNLYLTPSSFSLPPSRRSLYSAYELIQAVPLYDPHDTRSHLLAANSWIYAYLPNFPAIKTRLSPLPKTPTNSFLDKIESIAYSLQLSYMHRKITREHITPDSAYFHPRNPGSKILQKLKIA